MTRQALPVVREEFGFRRTACGCSYCQAACRHVPGSLAPSDLARLCPPGHDLLAWAERHLRAVTDKPFPTLVPARAANGTCHWYFDGRCAVHENAPFGCAFFDSHMSEAEAGRRAAATVQARRNDAAASGPYHRVWLHLRSRGLIVPSGDRAGLLTELQRLRRQAERGRRRVGD